MKKHSNAQPTPIPDLVDWGLLSAREQFDKHQRLVIDRNNLLARALDLERQLEEMSGRAAAARQQEVRETIAIGARLGSVPFTGVDAVWRSQEGIGIAEY